MILINERYQKHGIPKLIFSCKWPLIGTSDCEIAECASDFPVFEVPFSVRFGLCSFWGAILSALRTSHFLRYHSQCASDFTVFEVPFSVRFGLRSFWDVYCKLLLKCFNTTLNYWIKHAKGSNDWIDSNVTDPVTVDSEEITPVVASPSHVTPVKSPKVVQPKSIVNDNFACK